MRACLWVFVVVIVFGFGDGKHAYQRLRTERISGSAGDVLEDDPVGRLKVYVYELPTPSEPLIQTKQIGFMPLYTPTCDLTPTGLPLPFKSPRMMRSAVQLISSNWPYWNRTEGSDHFFVVPHDFGACFHYQEEKAIERGILPLLQRATLVQTFGQRNHVCLNEGSITIPPYAPPQKMQARRIPLDTPRSIFVYFRGLFYDVNNDPEGGYYARGARAAMTLSLPFADAIPWEEIGVFVAEEDVPDLDTILTSIPSEVILRKQRLLANPSMKRAMLFPQPAQPGDAFHQILNGLARKLPHDRTAYLKPGQKVLNWTTGPVGDLKPW
ncbi:EXOSTOSIN HEPARAN SULFATE GLYCOSYLTRANSFERASE -RELATED [Salix viminalis]|uniref:EXOSTOSIN HEPARAN SULFATE GLYCOSYLTRANSFERASE -RELATED n=1 Tax=Salix viminalis TaxID=40686 RepID=A0A9Q0QAW1_SALVM|nr:EXOSTOSIN HEPARAN SULFATE GLYCOSYLTRANSFERASE -RELATED [Salix viminalis]